MGAFLNPLKVIDPLGNYISNKISSTPFVSKEIHENPLFGNSTIAKMTPGVQAGNSAYDANNPQPAGPSKFAGTDPTLRDANAGYTGTPSGAAYNPNLNSQLYGLTPATQANGSNPNSTLAKQNTQPLSQQLTWGS